jgi:hypothetical protein
MSDDREHWSPLGEQGSERLIAVYRDEETARRAADAARAAGAADVAIGAERDRIAALAGEMRAEGEEAWAGPSVGIYTKEMAKSVPTWTVVATVIAAIVAFPLGFIPMGGLPLAGRIAIAAFAGAVCGGTIGFLVGGGFHDVRRKSRQPLAAEQGVVVGATDHDRRAIEALAGLDPVRLDVLASDGVPEETVMTERHDPARSSAAQNPGNGRHPPRA